MKKSILTCLVLMCTATSHAGSPSGLATFTSDTPAVASDVNDNFTNLVNEITDNDSRISTNRTDIDRLLSTGGAITVDCNAGGSIQQSLESAIEGAVLNISGTCTETVVIDKDRIQLVGQESASTIIDGQNGEPTTNVITIDGAQGVILSNLTVQNGLGSGVTARRGAGLSGYQYDYSK